MKCRRCGSECHGGFVCIICGNKNVGKERCPVCDRVIHHGQMHCTNCGTPTSYAKKREPIINNGVIDYTVHSESSHTYTAQEGYDYKKDAYQYDQIEKEPVKETSSWSKILKEKQAEIMKTRGEIFTKTNAASKKSGVQNAILGVILLLGAIGFIVNIISEEFAFKPAQSPSVEEVSIEDMTVFGTTSNLSLQANVKQGGLGYLYENEIYLVGQEPYVTNRTFDVVETINANINLYVYVNETTIYYLDYENNLYSKSKISDDSSKIASNVYEVVGVDDVLYYSKDNGEIYKYDLASQQKEVIAKDFQYCLQVDSTTNKLYYSNTDGKLVQLSLVDATRETYDFYCDMFFVEGNKVYTYMYGDGFITYDLDTKRQINTIEVEEVRWFERVDNGFLYVSDNSELCKVLDDGTFIEMQMSDIEWNSILLLGDKIFMTYDNGEYGYSWYVCNYNGQCAPLNLER